MAKSRFEQLNAAFKAITTGDFGEGVLLPKQFRRFIRMVQEDSPILAQTRRLILDRPSLHIDRTGFLERVLRAGDAADGTHKVLVQSEYAKPAFFINKLNAFEVQGTVSIYDKALRRNLEQSYYINTLLDGFNQAVGRDLAELFLYSDTRTDPTVDLFLTKTDGWARRAAQKLFGVNQGTGDGTNGNAARDFDPASTDAVTGFPANMFQAQLEALPKQYLRDPSQWVYKVDWATMDAYRDQIAKRIGSTADSALVGGRVHDYKGISLEYDPALEKYASAAAAGGTGRISMLIHPNNNVWGVFHEVTVEPSRHPEERRTAYVVTAEVDADYEDENAAVIAYIEKNAGQE